MASSRVSHYKTTKCTISSFTSLLCLLILLDMTKMGACAERKRRRNLEILDPKPVLLRNKYINGYLVRSKSYDQDRTTVRIERDIVSNQQITIGGGLSYTYEGLTISGSVSENVPVTATYDSAKWYLVEYDDGEHEIIHGSFNEPLYAASNYFAYDKWRRRVFSFKSGPSVNQGFWIFEKQPNGYYSIKNAAHGEYLYAASFPSKGWVFTWRRKFKVDDDDDNFLWQLIKA